MQALHCFSHLLLTYSLPIQLFLNSQPPFKGQLRLSLTHEAVSVTSPTPLFPRLPRPCCGALGLLRTIVLSMSLSNLIFLMFLNIYSPDVCFPLDLSSMTVENIFCLLARLFPKPRTLSGPQIAFDKYLLNE